MTHADTPRTSPRCSRLVGWLAMMALAGADAALALAGERPAWRQIEVTDVICPGDCDDDGATTVDELLTSVGISLGRHPLAACPAARRTRDAERVAIDDLIAAIASSLDGCAPARWVAGGCATALPEGQAAAGVTCGYLLVPEDRAAHNGRTLHLETVILHATGAERQPDPFVFLTGGPGSAALEGPYLASLTADFAAPIQAARDIVIFNQRGTGETIPWFEALACAEVRPLHERFAEQLAPDEEAARELAEVAACHQRLSANGVDLRAYDSAATARDLADLMTALGYARFNLYGLSYGARVALTALRDLPPARIRSVVLDSPAPPQVHLVTGVAAAATQRALERLFADCAAAPGCAAAYGDLARTTFDLVERLDARPLHLTPSGPAGPFDVVLTGDRLIRLLSIALQQNALIPFLPLAIASAAGGDATLATLALGALADPEPTAVGLTYAVLCNEETPFNTPQVVADAAQGVDPALVRALAADPRGTHCPWSATDVDPTENDPVSSAVPTLLLSGEYDASTPPAFATLAAATLSNSHVVEFRGYGHVVLGQNPSAAEAPSCAMQVIADFIRDPSRAPDRRCVDALPAPRFVGG